MNENVELLQQLHALTARVEKLEKLVGLQPAAPVKPQISEPVSVTPQKATVGENPPLPESVEHQSQSENSLGARLLGAVAIFCFLVAGGYFVKLAIDSGWLTPARQFAGVVLLGVSLLLAGVRLKAAHGNYSGNLSGGGLVLLYLAVLAGHEIWKVLSPLEAVLSLTAVSASGLWLFRFFSSGPFIVATCLGTYAVPLVLFPKGEGAETPWAYYLIWNVIFTYCAITWRERSVIALASYIALVGGIMMLEDPDFLPGYAAIFQCLQFLTFAAGTAIFSVRTRKALTEDQIWALFPGILLFYGIEYQLIQDILPGAVNWIALAFAFCLAMSTWLVKSSLGVRTLPSSAPLSGACSIIVFHAGYLELTPEPMKPWVGFLLLLATPILFSSVQGIGKTSIEALMLASVIGIESGKLLLEYNGKELTHTLFLPALYGGSLLFYSILMGARENLKDFRLFPLIFSNALILISLRSLAHVIFGVDTSAAYGVSALWALYAVILLLINRGDTLLARSSLGVFGIVAAKLLLLDSATQGLGFRIVMLLVMGVLFYIGGHLYGRGTASESTEKRLS